jgi:hypothetical protein
MCPRVPPRFHDAYDFISPLNLILQKALALRYGDRDCVASERLLANQSYRYPHKRKLDLCPIFYLQPTKKRASLQELRRHNTFRVPTKEAASTKALRLRFRLRYKSSCQTFDSVVAGLASRTAVRTFSTEGLKRRPFLATSRPSARTVSSPRFPSTSVTSTPGSCFKASAKLAACLRIPPQIGHCRITTFFMGCTPST